LTDNLAAGPCTHLLLQPPNWLGDVIMAQPAMRAFIAGLRPRRVSVWGRPWLADVLPFLDLQQAQYSASLPQADAAVLFPNSFRSAWMALRSHTPRRIGFRGQWRRLLLSDAPAPRIDPKTQHHRDYYLDLAEQMHMPVQCRDVRLCVLRSELQAGRKRLQRQGLDPDLTIAVAPGARFGGAKRYPPSAWAQVLGELARRGFHLMTLGTSEERPLAAAALAACEGRTWNAAGETSLRQGLQLLAASRMLLCNDSGLMHVAAGLGQPVVAVFGATDPARTAPSGPRAKLLYHPAPCSPCLARECRVPGHPCMANIKPLEILDACLELLRP
jgi:lipopolysaccharide heptosyltransferase II